MTSLPVAAGRGDATSVPGPSLPRRISNAVGPAFRVVFADRYRQGRLRLTGLSASTRWLARLGIVVLLAVNASLLYVSRGGGWRRGSLVQVSSGPALFAPSALVPLTLAALFVGWALILWGAALSSKIVRLATAVAFLLVNSDLASPAVIRVGKASGFRIGVPLVRYSFLTVAGLLVLSAFVGLFPAVWDRLRPIVLAGLLAAAASMFAGLVWVHATVLGTTHPEAVTQGLEGAVITARGLVVPVLFAAAAEVLELGYSAVAATAESARRARPAAARFVLFGLIAVKLVVEVFDHSSVWWAFVVHRRLTTVFSALAVGFFALCGLILRRPLRRGEGGEQIEDDEGLIYLGATALALPLVAVLSAFSVGSFLFNQFGVLSKALTIDLPSASIQRYGDVVVAVLLLAVGVALLVRHWRPPVAGAVVIVGGWGLAVKVPRLWGLVVPFNAGMFDVVLTVVVGVVAAARWRRLDGSRATRLAALVAFSWLVSTRGDYLTKLLGGFLPAAAIVTLVTGTLWALLTDSAFVAKTSRLFPGAGRPLLWIGLLLTLATLTNWVAIVHDFDLAGPVASGGFVSLGLPLAAWWVLHRAFREEPSGPTADLVVGPPTATAAT